MKLDPVAPGRVTADGGITAEVLLHLSPSGPGDPQVDHARRLHVRNLPARGDQGRLIAIARSPFRDRPDREHGDDESLPKHVTVVITHCRQDKRNVLSCTMDATRRLCEQNRTFCGRRTGSAPSYAVLGAGKTVADACIWLLDNDVEPDRIRWIRPRDAWFYDRRHFQPLEQVGAIGLLRP